MPSSSSSSPEIYATEPARESHFSYKDATQEEVLEDLSSRFILNLPDEELNSLERLCFQVEQAHWFYEDFIREENTKLPSMPLKKFSEMLFHACPLLQQWSHDHEEAFKHFMQYKTRVPVCGAIMLNDVMDKCVLVKGWKSSSNWGFPKGKINETEPSTSCAIREVLEETGYNLAGQIDPENVIELTIKEQKISLFIVPGVSEYFKFQTKTRKEISEITWFKLSDLPTWKKSKSQLPNRKFYLISPFIGPLKNYIINERRRRNEKGNGKQRRGNQGSNGSNGVFEMRANGAMQSSSTAQPNTGENELGPELSRLFSGLTTISHKGGGECTPEVSKISRTTGSSSDCPSDSSIELPVRTRAQLSSSSRQSAAPVAPSEQVPLHSRPSRLAMNRAVSPYPQIISEPHAPMQPTALPGKPATSRRASGTADISPYLSSKTELPVSAKTLQHLQLLETVADESARLAPILAARASLVRQSVPPNIPTSASSPNSHNLIYCSNHPSSATYPTHLPTGDTSTHNQQGSFQLRSRTSQSFNRPIAHNPTGSMTLHQNHLLAVINGARSVPVTPNYPFLQQPQQPPLFNSGLPPTQPLHAPYFSSTTPLHSYLPLAPPTGPPTCSPILGNESAFAHASIHSVATPIFNPPLAPTSDSMSQIPPATVASNPGTNIGPPVPNPLLSILNGRPA